MYKILFFLILFIAAFLLFYKINQLVYFIGDFGWFYLSARDALVSGVIPLISIPSSHPWLHQGPLWTYILIIILGVFHFDPLIPAYFTALLGLISVVFMYRFGSKMFSNRVGLITAFLYATSPLVILDTRLPYHTAPIPLFTILLLWSIYKWIKGKVIYFPLVLLFLAILYNFELATFSFWPVFLIIFVYGFYQKAKWVMDLFNKKIILLSFLSFLIPMLPILIYDSQHKFPQTFGFLIWMGYRILVLFGYPPLHPEIASPSISSVISFAAENYQKLLFINNGYVAFILFLFSFGYLYKTIILQIKNKKYKSEYVIISLTLTVTLIGFFATKTISDAYLPIFFPTIILMTAVWFDSLMKTKMLKWFTVFSIILLCFINSFVLISRNYLFGKYYYGATIIDKIAIAKQIVIQSKGREYNLIGKGPGSKFESFTMHYTYLTWWLGHEPVKVKKPLQFVISEDKNGVVLQKQDKKKQ